MIPALHRANRPRPAPSGTTNGLRGKRGWLVFSEQNYAKFKGEPRAEAASSQNPSGLSAYSSVADIAKSQAYATLARHLPPARYNREQTLAWDSAARPPWPARKSLYQEWKPHMQYRRQTKRSKAIAEHQRIYNQRYGPEYSRHAISKQIGRRSKAHETIRPTQHGTSKRLGLSKYDQNYTTHTSPRSKLAKWRQQTRKTTVTITISTA